MGRIDGKVAIITGAGNGFGRESTLLFTKEGAKVIIADMNAEAGKKVEEEVRAAGGEATFVQVDITVPEQVKNLVEATIISPTSCMFILLFLIKSFVALMAKSAPFSSFAQNLFLMPVLCSIHLSSSPNLLLKYSFVISFFGKYTPVASIFIEFICIPLC